jgi:hypothetical protein
VSSESAQSVSPGFFLSPIGSLSHSHNHSSQKRPCKGHSHISFCFLSSLLLALVGFLISLVVVFPFPMSVPRFHAGRWRQQIPQKHKTVESNLQSHRDENLKFHSIEKFQKFIRNIS